MTPRGRKPRSLSGRGEIRAESVYPAAVLMRRLGIGRATLTGLRRRGLPVHSLGRRCVVIYGWELVAFLRAEADSGRSAADQRPGDEV
jgi:hypothetical protein